MENGKWKARFSDSIVLLRTNFPPRRFQHASFMPRFRPSRRVHDSRYLDILHGFHGSIIERETELSWANDVRKEEGTFN